MTDYLPKPPGQLVPGDRIYIRPTGWLTVTKSFAVGNYHTQIGWQVHAEGPLGETVLSFTIHSLSSAPK